MLDLTDLLCLCEGVVTGIVSLTDLSQGRNVFSPGQVHICPEAEVINALLSQDVFTDDFTLCLAKNLLSPLPPHHVTH